MDINSDNNLSIFNLNNLNFYYGIPTSYTNFSIGGSNPYEAFKTSYENNMDFLFTTDLNNSLMSETKYKKAKWTLLKEYTKKFSKKKDNFISISGFEAKSVFIGDFAIINSKNYFTGIINNMNLLLLWLLNNPNALLIITNPIKDLTQIEYNELLDKVFSSFCVCTGTHPKYLRREKIYYSLLDKGYKLGAINSQANIKDDFGKYNNLTGVAIDKLSKEKLLTAFIQRKTYSSESSSLKLFFKANDYYMGDIIDKFEDYIDFNVFCEDKYVLITKLQIISSGGVIVKTIDNINLHKLKYLYSHHIEENQKWFLIKIFQPDDKISISSPIFLAK